MQKNQAPAPITQRRYIDIEDEAQINRQKNIAEERVRSAAQRALHAFQDQEDLFSIRSTAKKSSPSAGNSRVAQASAQKPNSNNASEVAALKSEIASLKQVITQFQHMPQNFVGSHPGADYGINYDLSFIFDKLAKAGIAPEIAAEILTQAQETLPALEIKKSLFS